MTDTTETTKTTTIRIGPVINDQAHADRIETAAKALEDAKGHVADMAAEWVDSGCYGVLPNKRTDGTLVVPSGAYADAAELRAAVLAWRDAGQKFLRAVAGES
jgi:hypothetical protein